MAVVDHEDPNPGQEQGNENSETPDHEVETPPAGEAHEEELTPEQLRANVTRANQQAAAERVKRQQALDDLEEMRGKLADMKSVEEVEALISDYQQKLVAAETATNRLLAAQAAGLPAGFENRLQGATYEEMLADAQSLAPMFGSNKTPPVPLPPKGGRTPQTDPADEPGAGWRAAKRKAS